jgi:diguanylate cyclase (GGDEF)-like protein
LLVFLACYSTLGVFAYLAHHHRVASSPWLLLLFPTVTTTYIDITSYLIQAWTFWKSEAWLTNLLQVLMRDASLPTAGIPNPVLSKAFAPLASVPQPERSKLSQNHDFWQCPLGRMREDAKTKALREAKSTALLENHPSCYDPLTGLLNRQGFIERLNQRLQATPKSSPVVPFAVLFVDLDRFKFINDSLGHEIGDQLLVAIAERLRHHFTQQAIAPSPVTLARVGGDEFAILLEKLPSISDATKVATAILQMLLPFDLNGNEIFVTASIGIALGSKAAEEAKKGSSDDGKTFSVSHYRAVDYLRDANLALYRAKALGSSRYEVFDSSMRASAIASWELQTDLRQAIERQELRLHYQPIYSLATGKISGFEALVRWQHPTRGLLFPKEFILLAEETGLIVPLGAWVLREACRQLQAWHQELPTLQPLTMSVNFSGKQFLQTDIVEQIDRVLQETGLSPKSLKLEITESLLIRNTDTIKSVMNQLHNRNIQLSLDDFGTGYSSLSYLQIFPLSTLKIDQSFVRTLSAEKLAIVQAIITLAHSLGMDVVAEGVETKAQLAQLQALHCEHGQGYWFSQPVNSTDAKKLIATDLALQPKPSKKGLGTGKKILSCS